MVDDGNHFNAHSRIVETWLSWILLLLLFRLLSLLQLLLRPPFFLFPLSLSLLFMLLLLRLWPLPLESFILLFFFHKNRRKTKTKDKTTKADRMIKTPVRDEKRWRKMHSNITKNFPYIVYRTWSSHFWNLESPINSNKMLKVHNEPSEQILTKFLCVT